MIYLLASFVLVNLTHGYLLLSQLNNSPPTISHHSIKNKTTYLMYVLTHLIAGILLGLFVLQEFGVSNRFLILATAFAVVAEWIQAIVPAKGKHEKTHTIFAGIMALSLILIVLGATLIVDTPIFVKVLGFGVVATTLSFIFRIRYPLPNDFWKLQFLGQTLLYFQMFLLLYYS